jgi:hypothetical protein
LPKISIAAMSVGAGNNKRRKYRDPALAMQWIMPTSIPEHRKTASSWYRFREMTSLDRRKASRRKERRAAKYWKVLAPRS